MLDSSRILKKNNKGPAKKLAQRIDLRIQITVFQNMLEPNSEDAHLEDRNY